MSDKVQEIKKMKNFNKILTAIFILAASLLFTVNSNAQTSNTNPKPRTYFCVSQAKNYELGILTSIKRPYFRLEEKNGVKTYNSLDDNEIRTGSWTIDSQGVITFTHNNNNGFEYFNHYRAYPSKVTPNRFHLKDKKEKTIVPLTCDLVRMGAEDYKESLIYRFVYEDKTMSQADEKALRDDYFAVMNAVDGSLDNYVPPKPKTRQEEMNDAYDELIKILQDIQADVDSEIKYLINPQIVRGQDRSEAVTFLRKYYKWMKARQDKANYWIDFFKERYGEEGLKIAGRSIENMDKFMSGAIENLINSGSKMNISRSEIVN
jgi:hypothetical protein